MTGNGNICRDYAPRPLDAWLALLSAFALMLSVILVAMSMTGCVSEVPNTGFHPIVRDFGPFKETWLYSKAEVWQPLMVPVLYEGKDCYQVVETWHCYAHEIPKGLIVDGASVPRWAWTFMPPDGLHRAAALYHDWIYLNKGVLPDTTTYSRAQADKCFFELMIECGVSERRAKIAYEGVRLGGWAVWNRPKEPPVILPVENRMGTQNPKPRNFLSHLYAP